MTKIAIEIEPVQVEKIIKQLTEQERQRLLKKLVRDEFVNVSAKLRKNIRKQKLSEKDVERIVAEARQEYYDRGSR